MKKILSLLVLTLLLGACSENTQIKIYTRDAASGTREAFESIIDLESISTLAAETTSNGDMAKQVGASKDGIGYVSLSTDFQANGLMPLSYGGVVASIDSVNDGTYKLARPFSFVTRASGDFDSQRKEQLVLALIDYMTLSIEGKEVILSEGGIVDVNKGIAWRELALKHPIVNEDNSDIKIKTGGSTSVEKTLNSTIESFIPMAGNFQFEPNHTGSSDGFKRTLGSEKDGANKVDIGFASRQFKAEESSSNALSSGVYCLDAVVVVVNKVNTMISDADQSLLVEIFSGKKTSW